MNSLYERAHEVVCKYDQERLRERWFATDEGLLSFAWEAVRTKDEHDGQLKSLPREFYLEDHFRNFLREPVYFVVKSRQIMITWSTYIALVWAAMRYRFCNTALIPKKDEDGEEHIEDRISGTIWPTLPLWLRKNFDRAPIKGLFHLKKRLWAPRDWDQDERLRDEWGKGLETRANWDSKLRSFAKGQDQLRSYTHRYCFWDEMAYQEYAEKGFRGAMATIGSRGKAEGRVVCVSTMVPNSFHDQIMGGARLVDAAVAVALGNAKPDDPEDKALFWEGSNNLYVGADHVASTRQRREPVSSPGTGIAHYRNKKYGAFCAVYAFLADSAKRAPEWEAYNATRFGGTDSPHWLLDYRMQRDAFRGVLVFPHFDVRWNVVPQRKVDRECEIFLSFDFGHTNPEAVLFWEWDVRNQTLTCFDEVYLTTTTVSMFKSIIQAKLADHLNMPIEDVIFSELLGDNVGDPENPGRMAEYGQEPNPLLIRGNPPPNPGGLTWRINHPVVVGESRLDSGFRPSFVCCGLRQYVDTGATEGVCVGRKLGENGEQIKCGRVQPARPVICIMEGRAPNFLNEVPLQQRVDAADPSLQAPERSKKTPDHACAAARYAVMRYPEFLAKEGDIDRRPSYVTKPIQKLGTEELFWRRYYTAMEDLEQQKVDDGEEIPYPDDEDETEDGLYDAY